MTAPRQVAVTGVGAVTPLGGSAPRTWAGLLAGRSGVGELRAAWARDLPVQIAARVARCPVRGALVDGAPVHDVPVRGASVHDVPVRGAAVRGGARAGRAARFLLAALREAWADAGFAGPAPPAERSRTGVCVGTGIGGALGLLGGSAAGLPAQMLGGLAAQAGREVGAAAGAHAFGTACAASADAIAYGLAMIRDGRADVVVAGGAEAAIHPLAIAAFARISALSRRNDEPARACRPFDKNRDGFVLGEGAAVLVLESAGHAAARGARVYCELAGAGMGADGWHITGPEPSGPGMAQALRTALADAGLAAEDVAHVNAHATASLQGDLAESRALETVLGPRGYCVSATKSMTGHLLGAAGAAEAVATALALRDALAPPTINLDDPDDSISLDVVRREPRPLRQDRVAALSCSAGFGGHNAVLAFRRWPS